MDSDFDADSEYDVSFAWKWTCDDQMGICKYTLCPIVCSIWLFYWLSLRFITLFNSESCRNFNSLQDVIIEILRKRFCEKNVMASEIDLVVIPYSKMDGST